MMTEEEFLNMQKIEVLRLYEKRGLKGGFMSLKSSLQPKYSLPAPVGAKKRADKTRCFREAQKLMRLIDIVSYDDTVEPEGVSTTTTNEPVATTVTFDETEETTTTNLTDDELDALVAESDSLDFITNFQWCSDNIMRRNLKVEDAPSGAAYKYWVLFSEDSNGKLFLEFSKKLHDDKIKNSTTNDKAMTDDKRKQFALINALLEPQVCVHCGEKL
jgi:hypothetical protein